MAGAARRRTAGAAVKKAWRRTKKKEEKSHATMLKGWGWQREAWQCIGSMDE